MTTRLLISIACASLALIVYPPRVHAGALAYAVSDLGTLGGTNSYAIGINASGQVAGYSDIPGGGQHAVRWTGTTPTDLGSPLGGSRSFAYGINDSGQTAGHSWETGDSGDRAIRWTGTTAQDLGTLGGTWSGGTGINNSGQIAGYSWVAGNTAQHATRWTGTTPTDLGTLGGRESFAQDINDSGQVAGAAELPDVITNRIWHAVRWTGTTAEDLGTLGTNASACAGYGINAFGQVAGYSDLLPGDRGPRHAVRWTGTTPLDLGTLGGTISYGFGINNFGDVTGMSTDGNGINRAFLFTSGNMYDLEAVLLSGSGVSHLTIDSSGSNSINDLGQIAAYGTINGQTHALRLDPVITPEPTAALLASIGLGVVALRRRARR